MFVEQESDTVLGSAIRQIVELKSECEELMRELALAEALIESQQRQLIAAGVLDPELRP